MLAFDKLVIARSCAALLFIAVAWSLASCGGGTSSPAESGEPNQLSFDELVISAGEERALIAEQVTIRTRFDVKGTLVLSLPPGSTADRVIVRLPPGAVIEGTIALRQPARAAASSATTPGRAHALAADARATAFVPRHVPTLMVEGGIPGTPLYIYATGRLENSAGDDAPDEVLGNLGQLNAAGVYDAARGGNGGDIHVFSNGAVVLRFPLGVPDDAYFRTFAPGSGGRGADLVFNDGTWNDAGLSKATIRAGAGGDSGRLFIYAAEIRLEDERVDYPFVIQAAFGTGVGGAGGKLTWDVVQPDLTSLDKILVQGGAGGGGMGLGGPGGAARFAAGKPIVPAGAPRPVGVLVVGGDGGAGALDRLARPMVELSPTPTRSDLKVQAHGAAGGQVTAVAHTGRPGTADHPDGYEPGPLEVRFGWGGDVSIEPLFIGRAANGAGMEAGVARIRGGDGGEGYSTCGGPNPVAGGAGGRSGHVTVRAGIGGYGPSGGDAGTLFYDGVDLGRPGKGGMGLTGGPAGFYGQPDRSPVEPPLGTDVRDHPGLRLEGVFGGESRDGRATVSSQIQGAFVLPERTAGETCDAVPPLTPGRIPLPAALYHWRFSSSAFPDVVSELMVTTSADCLFLDTRPGLLGVGYVDQSRPCITVHEVIRTPNAELDPRGFSEQISDRTQTVIDNGRGVRASQFLLRQSFCTAQGTLVLPGTSGASETFVYYDRNGDPLPGPIQFNDYSASVAPIYPSEVEQTRNYCCKVANVLPNGQANGYDIGQLVGGVCR